MTITAADVGRELCNMAPSQRAKWLAHALGFLPSEQAKALIDEIGGT